jgi:hypothetical protein
VYALTLEMPPPVSHQVSYPTVCSTHGLVHTTVPSDTWFSLRFPRRPLCSQLTSNATGTASHVALQPLLTEGYLGGVLSL